MRRDGILHKNAGKGGILPGIFMGIFRFYADCAFVAHLSGRKAISGVFRKIAGVQAVVTALLGNQLIVGAALNNAALFQHHDAVRVAHGGKAVGDDKAGTAFQKGVEALLHQAQECRWYVLTRYFLPDCRWQL